MKIIKRIAGYIALAFTAIVGVLGTIFLLKPHDKSDRAGIAKTNLGNIKAGDDESEDKASSLSDCLDKHKPASKK